MMLRMTQKDYQKILNHAVSELPNEACGLIAGTVEDGVKVVREVYLLTNVDASREHFSMKPEGSQGYPCKGICDVWKLAFAPGIAVPSFRGGQETCP